MPRVDAFFLPIGQGNRFCLLHEPRAEAATHGAVLFVPPFAEELNNARRIAALQARAFAEAGWAVLQLDLFGCGDSDGDFADATWERWIEDVVEASRWLRERTSGPPVMWGLRLGCMLAAEAARAMQTPSDFLFWQPVTSGQQFLQQFLRLKVAQQVVAPSQGQFSGTREIRDQLARGETIEIAGYDISPAMANALESATLAPPEGSARIAWLEISRAAELSPAARAHIEKLGAASHAVDARPIDGAAFWQIPGIDDCPALVQASVSAIEGWRP